MGLKRRDRSVGWGGWFANKHIVAVFNYHDGVRGGFVVSMSNFGTFWFHLLSKITKGFLVRIFKNFTSKHQLFPLAPSYVVDMAFV